MAVGVLAVIILIGLQLRPLDRSVVRIAGTACIKPLFGTAVAVADDRLLTSAHVVAGAEDDLAVITLDGAKFPVEVVAFDPKRDLALLAVEGAGLDPLELGQPAKADDRGQVWSVSRDHTKVENRYRVKRVISARSGDIYDEGVVTRNALDIEADIDPGVSGAPLVDGSEQMVGIVFARSTGTEGVGYALHVDEIADFLAMATGDEPVDRGRCR